MANRDIIANSTKLFQYPFVIRFVFLSGRLAGQFYVNFLNDSIKWNYWKNSPLMSYVPCDLSMTVHRHILATFLPHFCHIFLFSEKLYITTVGFRSDRRDATRRGEQLHITGICIKIYYYELFSLFLCLLFIVQVGLTYYDTPCIREQM